MTSIETSGVVGHSGASGQEPWVIASVSNASSFHVVLKGMRKRFKVLEGCYEGKIEVSFLLDMPTYEWALIQGWFDDQESILMLGPMERFGETTGRRAELQYLGAKPAKQLGLFVETIIKPEGGTPYTFDHLNGTYFQCVPLPSKNKRSLSKFTDAEQARHYEAYLKGRVSSPVLA